MHGDILAFVIVIHRRYWSQSLQEALSYSTAVNSPAFEDARFTVSQWIILNLQSDFLANLQAIRSQNMQECWEQQDTNTTCARWFKMSWSIKLYLTCLTWHLYCLKIDLIRVCCSFLNLTWWPIKEQDPSSSGLCKASTARIDCSKKCTWELLWVPARGHLIQTLAAVWLLAMCTLGDWMISIAIPYL